MKLREQDEAMTFLLSFQDELQRRRAVADCNTPRYDRQLALEAFRRRSETEPSTVKTPNHRSHTLPASCEIDSSFQSMSFPRNETSQAKLSKRCKLPLPSSFPKSAAQSKIRTNHNHT
ncbi:hypothetical protein ISN44_As13g003340 [Arabidopsis suecica]|uniref:Uncharacterized protein n=1 Tax=Arabidopsis suecica TaxID=45249 RepID=A0A8T1XP98_ARASU|nr:hypothetical protein ISN44_As13g003340 [Arabidopsis suecica]